MHFRLALLLCLSPTAWAFGVVGPPLPRSLAVVPLYASEPEKHEDTTTNHGTNDIAVMQVGADDQTNEEEMTTEEITNDSDSMEEPKDEEPSSLVTNDIDIDNALDIDLDLDTDDMEDDISMEDSTNKAITHLQKKLRYWKKEQKTKEDAYKLYLHQHATAHKTKPLYKREGKIDHYQPRPVYDKETERIQTEIWSIKQQITLAHAKLAQERRMEQIQAETAYRLAHHDEELAKWQQQADAERAQALEQLKAEAEAEKEALRQQLQDEMAQRVAEKQAELERFQQRAQEEQEQLQQQADARLQALQSASEQRLEEKEQEIATLVGEMDVLVAAKEQLQAESSTTISEKDQKITHLVMDLQTKRSEVATQASLLATLEQELQAKQAVLEDLQQELDSLRAMLKRSWKVVKTRFKRNVLRKKQDGDGEDESSVNDESANGSETLEKVMVGTRRGSKFD